MPCWLRLTSDGWRCIRTSSLMTRTMPASCEAAMLKPPRGIIQIMFGVPSRLADENSDDRESRFAPDDDEDLTPKQLDAAIEHCRCELKCLRALRAGDREAARHWAERLKQLDGEDSDDG